jgi:hypothetical protein
MRRLAGILGVAAVAFLPGCAEDTNTTMPGKEVTKAGTESLETAKATDDSFAEARADAVPLIRKAMDELDKVQVPCRLPGCATFSGTEVAATTATAGSNLRHVATAADLVQQACFIFEGVDHEIDRHFCIAADRLIGAANAIGSTPKAVGATHELHVAAEHIDAVIELLALPITT